MLNYNGVGGHLSWVRRYRAPVFTESHGDVLSRGASKVQENACFRCLGRLGQAFFQTATDSHRYGTGPDAGPLREITNVPKKQGTRESPREFPFYFLLSF